MSTSLSLFPRETENLYVGYCGNKRAGYVPLDMVNLRDQTKIVALEPTEEGRGPAVAQSTLNNCPHLLSLQGRRTPLLQILSELQEVLEATSALELTRCP